MYFNTTTMTMWFLIESGWVDSGLTAEEYYSLLEEGNHAIT